MYFICFLLFFANLAISCEFNLDLKIYKNKYGMFYLPPKHFRPAVKKIKNGLVWEQETLNFIESIYEKGTSVVHAGAYFGDMLPFFSTLVGNEIVWAFEPIKDNFYFAKKNIELNGLNNVVLFNTALSNKKQQLYMKTIDNGVELGGASRVIKKARNNNNDVIYIVDALTLDDLLKEDQRRIGLIHLDIEGHEIIALEGCKAIIKKFRPTIILEVWKNRAISIEHYMNSINYRFIKMVDGNGVFFPNEKIYK